MWGRTYLKGNDYCRLFCPVKVNFVTVDELHQRGLTALGVQSIFQVEDSKQNYATIFKPDGTFRDDFQLYGELYLRSEEMMYELGSILSGPVLHESYLYFGSSNGKLYCLSFR
jgi:hypothetical protein